MTTKTLNGKKGKTGLRDNFPVDDTIENLLASHFDKNHIGGVEAVEHFTVYARRIHLKRFLALYEFYRLIRNLPGDIIELGVYNGATLMAFANFVEILNMGDRQKQVFGFDTFTGFPSYEKESGKYSANEDLLKDAISIFDSDRFIPYKPRVRLIKGDICETLPQFLKDTPGLRLSLVHFDADLYKPTIVGLELLWPLLVKGGVFLFDEYGIRPWGGESQAVDEFFRDKSYIINRSDWTANPGGYVVKR